MSRRTRATVTAAGLFAVVAVAVAVGGAGVVSDTAGTPAPAAAVDGTPTPTPTRTPTLTPTPTATPTPAPPPTPTDGFAVTQTPATVTVTPGETVTVDATLTATGVDSPAAELTAPDGWAVVDQTSPGASYRSSRQQWLWLRSGEQTVTYTLRVPADADPGRYTLALNGSALTDADTFVADTARTTVEVRRRAVVPTVAGLSVPANATVGETLRVETTLSNDRDRAGNRTVELLRDGRVVASRTVTVGADTRTVTAVAFTPSAPGAHTVRVGETTASVTVASLGSPTLRIDAPADGAVTDGDGVRVEFEAEAVTGDREVVYRVDGGDWQPAASEPRGDGGPGGASVSVTRSFVVSPSPGEHTVAVGVRLANGSVVAVTDRRVVVDAAAPTVSLSGPATVGAATDRTVTATVDERTLRTATVTVSADGETVTRRTVTSAVGDGTATLPLASLVPDESGSYTLSLTAEDGLGRTATATRTVTVDATAPTLSETALRDVTRRDGRAYTDRRVTVTGAVRDAASVASVTVLARSATGAHTETATATVTDGRFEATLDLGAAPAGAYDLRVRATDTLGNAGGERVGRVVLDRTAPTLGVAVTATDATTGRVTVTSDEPLATAPTVTVTFPDGDETTVTTTATADGYRGTFDLRGDGRYRATARGRDRAGRLGEAASETTVRTGVTVDGRTATIRAGDGTYVRLQTTGGETASAVASLTASDTPLAALTGGLNGSQFLTAELGPRLSDRLESAEIGVPRSEVTLPPGTDESDLQLRRFDPAGGSWERVADTSVATRTVGGETREYVVVTVPGFSTYGAVVVDTAPPTVTGVTTTPPPGGDDTLAYDTDRVTTAVRYTDDVAGVNASSVSVTVDGRPITAVAGATATVTADATTVDWQGLAPGDHTVTVTVTDEAGKTTSVTRQFTVARDRTAPTLQTGFANGTVLPPRTAARDVTVSWTDGESGVDPATVTATLDGESLPASALAVGPDGVTVSATGLSAGSHRLRVTVTDAAGNRASLVRVFAVGRDTVAPTLAGVDFDPSPVAEAPATFPVGVTPTVRLSFDTGAGGFDRLVSAAVGPAGDRSSVTDEATVRDGTVRVPVAGLSPGEATTLAVTVADAAGNRRTVTRTVAAAADRTAPTLRSLTVAGEATADGVTLPADTDSAGVVAEVRETGAGLATASDVQVQSGAARVTGVRVRDGRVTATLTGLAPGTEQTLLVRLRDAAGNTETVTRTVRVAERTQSTATETDGGGGGSGGPEPFTEIQSVELLTDAVPAGGDIRIRVTVRNDGKADGKQTVSVVVPGDAVYPDVSVPAESTVERTVTVTAPTTTGSVVVRADEKRLGTVRVVAAETATETATPTPTPTPTPTRSPTATAAPTPTRSPTATATATATRSPTVTTETQRQPGATSARPASPTATQTPTVVTTTETDSPGLDALAGLAALLALAAVALRRR